MPRAYAIIAGLTPPAVSGAQFLVDGDGWLRAIGFDWNDAAAFARALAAIRTHPAASMGNAMPPMKM